LVWCDLLEFFELPVEIAGVVETGFVGDIRKLSSWFSESVFWQI
jgi:hypothetical protein